ncbi:hypothetical protein BJY17_001029 [Agromyces hippuratus]|uniref:DUF3800 domain-containing protein n=1 Tax=Agromyces hippuratus TaxID=286438 RepID=A0A852WQ31_9MICO|nr:hypothetical protein [Agromyces hippuratus]NYG20282.1 hypothetical protein [Agromyces hippuratus]
MHIFLVDETNRDYVENHFFIVGGLVYTPEQIPLVDAAVAACRAAAGYRPGDNFKFNTNERPSYVSPETHREAKKSLIADLRRIGVRMIVSVVLHDLCRNQTYDERMEWSLNTVAGAYRKLLVADQARGIMLMDRDNDRFDHLEHLFQHGLTFQDGSHIGLHDRIVLFGMTNDNASNLSSAADIALGAFRYSVNTAVGAGREPVAREMFPDLAAIMWSGEVGGRRRFRGFGYLPRPLTPVAPHLARYTNLAEALHSYSIDPL